MKIFKFIFLLLIITPEALGNTIFKDNFKNPEKWLFITDQVMGGISSGKVEFININNNLYARMIGNVSTKNNGGFIQVRRKLEKLNLDGSKFIEIIAKGNNQNYFIHLRTLGTFLPWQYYQISFKVINDFKTFKLPINEFKRSSVFLSKNINPKNITSIGIVAFGRDHYADIYIKEINFTN
tara:strand:+ start:386 stop:928 length:543 start_codon:yes stop_codon:yes gene_type:complete